MNRFFNIDNPVWKFIGNLADMFILSVLWYICLIPVVTAGCGTSAVYYVTLKMTEDLEGKTIPQFLSSFRTNFKQATALWLAGLIIAVFLFLDVRIALLNPSSFSLCLVVFFGICEFILFVVLSMLFPLIARCEDTIKTQLRNCVNICVRNPLAAISVALINAAIFLFGIFVFWPLLLIAPGLCAYLNSYVINHIFRKYSMNL